MDVFDITWRIANVMLASIAGFLLIWTYSERWSGLRSPDRMIGVSFTLLLVTAALGSIEQMIRDIPPGVRTGFVTVALAYLIWGLVNARYMDSGGEQ